MWAVLFAAIGISIAQPAEVVSAIQIHGNTITPDEEIRTLANIQIGMSVEPGTVPGAGQRRGTDCRRSVGRGRRAHNDERRHGMSVRRH